MTDSASLPPILVAEDNADDLFFLQRALRRTGTPHSVLAFENGQKLVEFLRTPDAPRPRLIFLDIKMPVMSGFEVLEWMRAEPSLAGLPVVMLSGSAVPSDIAKAKSLGVREYLVKPPTTEALAAVLKAVEI